MTTSLTRRPTRHRSVWLVGSLVSTALCGVPAAHGAGTRHYVLAPLPSARQEATRMDRTEISDEQPTGLYLKRGDRFTLVVAGSGRGTRLSARVGFRSMWSGNNVQQLVMVRNGQTTLTARTTGPLMLILSGRGAAATVDVSGGRRMPSFVDGKTTQTQWRDQLRRFRDAPFVNLVSTRSMITISMPTYRSHPIADPSRSIAAINQVIAWEDEIAGFDGSSPTNTPTTLRIHYVEDIYVSAKESQKFYMYETAGLVGMLSSNTMDLTSPERLATHWAIWHETGHTQQQHSWTWNALGEINVNVFSLFVQQKFAQPSRLGTSEDATGVTTRELARRYLASTPADYTVDNEDLFFVKLVMFDQIRQTYGWGVFSRMSQAVREAPLSGDATDTERVDFFIQMMCKVTGNNLVPFFGRWGLRPGAAAAAAIDGLKYPLPAPDPATLF